MPFCDTSFLFRTDLSFTPLFEYWRSIAADSASMRSTVAARLLDYVADAPELHGPISDPDVLQRHEKLVGMMMELILPWSLGRDTHVAVMAPFSMKVVHASPEFDRLKLLEKLDADMRSKGKLMEVGKSMSAYHHILHSLYGVENDFEYALVVTVNDERTGLDRSFRISFDPRFSGVKYVGEGAMPELSDDDIRRMRADRLNLDLWRKLLPSELFALEGFVVVTAVDITDQEMMSLIRRDLLQKDAMDSPEGLDRLQNRIRSVMKKKDLQLGIISLERGNMEGKSGVRPLTRSLLLSGSEDLLREEDFKASIYGRMCETGGEVMINDLAEVERSPFEEVLFRKGIRNIVVAPLRYQDQMVGVIEIGSPNPGDIHFLNAVRLSGISSLFGTALRRMLDERENHIQAIIKEHYTAIHPTVEWRFRDAARHWIDRPADSPVVEPEQIVFRDVYSLYGLSDIRGSSTERNRSIKADLLEQLQLAHAVVADAARLRTLPILDELGYRIVKKLTEIEQNLHSGDEIRILEFLKEEVESLFPQLETFDPSVRRRVDAYRSALDPTLGVIYRERRDYEESVTLINDTVSAFIDREQERAQKMFPHYFEKFKTDGVDYNMYVGAALREKGEFDPLFLHNLRLWQLTLTCGIHWELGKIRGRLKSPLDVAHLVLVQDTPISIRFRIDEKKFDVDGAYNVRYEIVKKRIDKATIKGSGERLTQPGMIAIVYTQEKEAAEYRRYIEYLTAAGYLDGEIEDVELEDLQGVHGLRALRVAIGTHMLVGETENAEKILAR